MSNDLLILRKKPQAAENKPRSAEPAASASVSGVPVRLGPRPKESRPVDPEALLNLLVKSPLADVPQHLLSSEQIFAVLRGEHPEPTPEQRRLTARSSRWDRKLKPAGKSL